MARNKYFEELYTIQTSTLHDISEPYIYSFLDEITDEELEKNYNQLAVVAGLLIYMLSKKEIWQENWFLHRMIVDTNMWQKYKNLIITQQEKSIEFLRDQVESEQEKSRLGEVFAKKQYSTIRKLTEEVEELKGLCAKENKLLKVDTIITGTIQHIDYIFKTIQSYATDEYVFDFKSLFKTVKKRVIVYRAVVNSKNTLALAVLIFDESDYEILTFSSFSKKYPELNVSRGEVLKNVILTKDASVYLSTKESEARMVLSDMFGDSSNPKILMDLAESWQTKINEIKSKFAN